MSTGEVFGCNRFGVEMPMRLADEPPEMPMRLADEPPRPEDEPLRCQ